MVLAISVCIKEQGAENTKAVSLSPIEFEELVNYVHSMR